MKTHLARHYKLPDKSTDDKTVYSLHYRSFSKEVEICNQLGEYEQYQGLNYLKREFMKQVDDYVDNIASMKHEKKS